MDQKSDTSACELHTEREYQKNFHSPTKHLSTD